jgi:hypothetical protein
MSRSGLKTVQVDSITATINSARQIAMADPISRNPFPIGSIPLAMRSSNNASRM